MLAIVMCYGVAIVRNALLSVTDDTTVSMVFCTDCNTAGMCSVISIVASIRSALLSLTDMTTQFRSFCCTNCIVFD